MSQPLVHTVATKQQLFRPVSLTRKGIGNEERRSEAQSRPDLIYNVELTSAGVAECSTRFTVAGTNLTFSSTKIDLSRSESTLMSLPLTYGGSNLYV